MRAGGRALRTSALILGAALLVAACTDGGDGDDGGAPTTTAAATEAVDGGAISVGLGGPVVVDPVAANPGSPSDLMVLDLLHDGLTRADADGTVVPALAEKWNHNGKATAWAFTLDPDATFASGRPVTAKDVIASLERVMAAGDTSLAALRLELVTGFKDYVAGKAKHVSGLTVRADGSVRIGLDAPLSVLPAILAAPEMGIVDVASLDEAVGDGGDLGSLDLSGAWAVGEADGDVLRLERREGAAGHLDGVDLRTYDDVAAAYDAFEDGDVDWALVPPAQFDDAVEAHGDDHFAPFHAEVFFGLRVRDEPLTTPALRRAIVAAVDRDAIVEAVYQDRAVPLETIVPEGVADPARAACDSCGYHPNRAKAIIEKAYPDGKVPTVQLDYDESPAQEAMAELVEADLRAAGIPVEARPQPLSAYKRFVVSGRQRMFSFGWIGGYRSPDAYLAPLFASAANDNLTGYRDARVDAALQMARGPEDGAARHWARVEARVLESAVVVPIAQFRTQPVVADRVRELAHAIDGSVDWAAVWVADGA